MLPINVHTDTGTDPFTMLLPLLLCCMLPMLFQRPSGGESPQVTAETDALYVSYGIQEAYDAIVKEVDGWRENASRRPRGRFSFLSRKKPVIFVVDQNVAPRLYRVRDDQVGEISFELTEVGEGGTSIKSTYGSKARTLIQDFRARMPSKIPSSGPKVCPTCGKEMMPDFKTCPYCGTRIR